MKDRLEAIKNRVLEFWNKYTVKQKTIILSVILGIVCTIAILSFVLTRTEFKKLITCDTTKQANEVVELLEGAGIEYQISNNSTVISVDTKSYDAARLLLGANDITEDSSMTTEELFNNSLSTTESERKLKSNIYLQDKLANTIKTFDGVKDAVVYITSKETDSSILSTKVEDSASIVLTITDDFLDTAARSIAEMVASALDTTTEKVRVTSSSGTVLYDGTSDLYTSGDLASVEEYKKQLTNTRANDIRILLIKQGYDDAEVLPNFSFDMDVVSELYTEYTPTEGSDQGLYSSSYEYKAENATGAGGVPGTDTNGDDITYEIEETDDGESKVEYSDIEYLPNVRVTNTEKEVGAINASESSISIVLTTYKVYSEEILEEKGELKGTTFEEYIEDNNLEKVTALEVDENLYQSVSSATGIATGSISITSYEQPIFKFKEETVRSFSDYLMIILLICIVALLVFVVIKATAPTKVEELEPELSIEEMLTTSAPAEPPKPTFDEIKLKAESERMKSVEDFVTKNPDAVAGLLRNWLNEEE